MDIFECIKTRRSTRKYTQQPVEKELIEKVIEAGRYAPSGGNSQTTHFIVITNKKVLSQLAQLVQQEFAKMEVTEGMYRSKANAVNSSKKGGYTFHYNAPVLVVTANKKGYPNAMADCSCALENMMIEANALGLGSCWINQLHWLDENPVVSQYMKSIGLKNDETICGGLSLGYSDNLNRSVAERKGNPITYVD